jgi:hypothetical protein
MGTKVCLPPVWLRDRRHAACPRLSSWLEPAVMVLELGDPRQRRAILTVSRLGLPAELRRSLACTNIIENMMGTVRRVTRNVKRWSSPSMALRWTYFAATLVDSRTQRARWARPIDTSDGTACSQTGCTCLHRGAKAQPGGRFIRSGGEPGIADRRLPLACALPARGANRPPLEEARRPDKTPAAAHEATEMPTAATTANWSILLGIGLRTAFNVGGALRPKEAALWLPRPSWRSTTPHESEGAAIGLPLCFWQICQQLAARARTAKKAGEDRGATGRREPRPA